MEADCTGLFPFWASSVCSTWSCIASIACIILPSGQLPFFGTAFLTGLRVSVYLDLWKFGERIHDTRITNQSRVITMTPISRIYAINFILTFTEPTNNITPKLLTIQTWIDIQKNAREREMVRKTDKDWEKIRDVGLLASSFPSSTRTSSFSSALVSFSNLLSIFSFVVLRRVCINIIVQYTVRLDHYKLT